MIQIAFFIPSFKLNFLFVAFDRSFLFVHWTLNTHSISKQLYFNMFLCVNWLENKMPTLSHLAKVHLWTFLCYSECTKKRSKMLKNGWKIRMGIKINYTFVANGYIGSKSQQFAATVTAPVMEVRQWNGYWVIFLWCVICDLFFFQIEWVENVLKFTLPDWNQNRESYGKRGEQIFNGDQYLNDTRNKT